jgi:hypothetical protein
MAVVYSSSHGPRCRSFPSPNNHRHEEQQRRGNDDGRLGHEWPTYTDTSLGHRDNRLHGPTELLQRRIAIDPYAHRDALGKGLNRIIDALRIDV